MLSYYADASQSCGPRNAIDEKQSRRNKQTITWTTYRNKPTSSRDEPTTGHHADANKQISKRC